MIRAFEENDTMKQIDGFDLMEVVILDIRQEQPTDCDSISGCERSICGCRIYRW